MNKTRENPETLTVIGHIEELRKRIILSLIFLSCGTVFCFVFAADIMAFLKAPAGGTGITFVFVKPTEVLTAYFLVSLYAGGLLSSPALLYQFWKFIKPAVGRETGISIALWALSVAGLFALGTVFAYKLALPLGLRFLMGFSRSAATPMLTLNNYISFVLAIMVVSGIIFEMPVISAFLTRVRLITPDLLKKRRKEAIFILFVLAAVLTPTTDIFNMLIFVAPMLVLYEISILSSILAYRPYRKELLEEVYKNEA
jgi:sec-independent protein translocase protein TatC